MSNTLRAFHGDPAIKAKYLSRLAAHEAADEIIQGTGWENGKGCAVGCTLHGYHHNDYETEIGIDERIAYLEDSIFEGLPNAEAKLFPRKLLAAIPVGCDTRRVWHLFTAWMLADPVAGVIRFTENDTQRSAINGVAMLHTRAAAWDAASAAAWDAASAAASAVAWAAESAAASDAESAAAWAAARAAARDAASDAAWAAARDAASAAAWAAESAATWAAAYRSFAEKLISLFQAEQVQA